MFQRDVLAKPAIQDQHRPGRIALSTGVRALLFPALSTVEVQTCQLDALVMLVIWDQYQARRVAASTGVPVLQWHARRIQIETIFQGDALATGASMVR